MQIRLELEISRGNRGAWLENVERTEIERIFLVIILSTWNSYSGGIAEFHGRHHRRVKRSPYATPTHKDARWAVHHVSRASARTYTCSVDGMENLEGGREPRTGS